MDSSVPKNERTNGPRPEPEENGQEPGHLSLQARGAREMGGNGDGVNWLEHGENVQVKMNQVHGYAFTEGVWIGLEASGSPISRRTSNGVDSPFVGGLGGRGSPYRIK